MSHGRLALRDVYFKCASVLPIVSERAILWPR
jgi:hypothetical protein